ncbi:MAG: hypothetical protein KDA20_07400 [Phycisphaerales bacterium]|nr:hypothetical protein [Phycisphaerales bacterium]
MDVGNVAPWKWGVLIGAGLLAIVVWFFVLGGRDKVQFTDGMDAIDIETGQVFFLPIPPQRMYPGTNPDTGKQTLFPAWEDEDGTWYLVARYFPSDSDFRDQVKVKVDWSTGRVETNGKEVRRAE